MIFHNPGSRNSRAKRNRGVKLKLHVSLLLVHHSRGLIKLLDGRIDTEIHLNLSTPLVQLLFIRSKFYCSEFFSYSNLRNIPKAFYVPV